MKSQYRSLIIKLISQTVIDNMLRDTSFVPLALIISLSLLIRLPNVFVLSFGPSGYVGPSRQHNDVTLRLQMFFAEESASDDISNVPSPPDSKDDTDVMVEESPPPVQLVISDSETFLNHAGSFLVSNFWLGSDHHMLEGKAMTDDARMNLVIEQAADLQEKYGERMGKRLNNCCVIGALDEETKELIGLATLKETLLIDNDVLESEKAESIAKNAVAALGPKQRREYKNAPIRKIADELLSENTKAVCVMSNLAVGKKARRRGVARALCQEVEAMAGEDWGFDEVHLLVESENTAARTLYEKKLGYKPVFMNEGATALRIDFETGDFLEIKQDTLIMAKKL
jgi:ribosomal protein S18 acetylase RimI-like enzyme